MVSQDALLGGGHVQGAQNHRRPRRVDVAQRLVIGVDQVTGGPLGFEVLEGAQEEVALDLEAATLLGADSAGVQRHVCTPAARWASAWSTSVRSSAATGTGA
ncbi:MAG TPA: hypothetical protein DCQ30_09810, partial [Acidimicrobiaceae bacterium]|nr:hypothetical protein [Acidimicrobiaceae bacterium]